MLHLKNIHRTINNQEILQGIDLHVLRGQAYGLVGPNGCGKTSLLNIISGFTHPTQGTIHLQNQDISNMSVSFRAKQGVGRVFQHFGIFEDLTVWENLALAFYHHLTRWQKLLPVKTLSADRKSQIAHILQKIDLTGKEDMLAGSLSGGQKRLLEIARLYLQDTQLFLLDEPTAGVAPKLKIKVIDFIKELIKVGKTVIIIEHDFDFLGEFVDILGVMNQGKIVLEGSYQKIKNDSLLKEVYFGKKT